MLAPFVFFLVQLVGPDCRRFLIHRKVIFKKVAVAAATDEQKNKVGWVSFVARHMAVLDPLGNEGHYTRSVRDLTEVEVG